MDTRFRNVNCTDSNESKVLDISFQVEGTRAEYSKNTFLKLDSPGLPTPCLSTSNGSKQKCSLIDGFMAPKVVPSLSLGLCCSSSSSDSKETDDGSSIDIELDIMPHCGNDKTFNLKRSATPSLKESRVHPIVDLELSLCTGANESDITAVFPSSNPPRFVGKIPRITALNVLRGSTSCLWGSGVVLPPMQNLCPLEAQFFSNPVTKKDEVKQTFSDPSQSILTMPKSSVSCTSGIPQQDKSRTRTSNFKACQVVGCGKGARGASGRCISHGGGRRCQKPGCDKGADGRTVYCKAHGGGRRCERLGCTKSAEGRTDFCIAHGGGKRCIHEGCTRAARGKSGLCIRHGGGKRCQRENCTKSAEGLSGLCISHGGGRRCQFIGCTKGAQGSTTFCKAHGGGKRCTTPGCTKGAEGSTMLCKGHGGGKRCSFQGKGVCAKSVHGGTSFCVAHGGGKRCAVPECTKSARGRTDCCVRHGGGKRCKFERCGKSAQGSTDFCKAHGGGKKCSWGRLGSEYYTQPCVPCNSFARRKTGLCTLHNGLVVDKRVHGGVTLGPIMPDTELGSLDMAGEKELNNKLGILGVKSEVPAAADTLFNEGGGSSSSDVVPEGRVHGGSLLAMLADSSGVHLTIDGPPIWM